MLGTLGPSVRINLQGLSKFRQRINAGGAPVDKLLKIWQARYKQYILQRFDKYSKGGGDWPALSPFTVARKSKKGGNTAILVDTGQMRLMLDPEIAGDSGTKYGKWFVSVGFGGAGGSHGNVTLADIASFHQAGGPNLPQRKILVPPDVNVLKLMALDAEKILKAQQKEDVEG